MKLNDYGAFAHLDDGSRIWVTANELQVTRNRIAVKGVAVRDGKTIHKILARVPTKDDARDFSPHRLLKEVIPHLEKRKLLSGNQLSLI